jgi:large subunit ribosomal protein L6
MSRIGENPVDIPSGVTVEVQDRTVKVKGSLGELSQDLPGQIEAEVVDGKVLVKRPDDTRVHRSYHGLIRTLIANMVEGVSKGYSKELEIQGVGFKAVVQGQKVLLSLGFASPVEYNVPDGVTVTVENNTKVVVTGIDKQKVGNSAARMRSFYPAEPYKGKGVRYKGEHVRRKVGKTVA